MAQPLITILMATYNGEAFIKEQLNSILSQTYKNWALWVRDDGSTDHTVEILKSYALKYPKISVFLNDTDERGACQNFSVLFRMAKLDEHVKYVMFCDQDDIWLSTKIEITLREMARQEILYPAEPVLVYTDLELVDQDGIRTGNHLRLKDKIDLRNLVSFNYVLGCTMLLNRAMIYKIQHIPNKAANHDYWIALVASLYRSSYLNERLIQYRQHTQNVSGNVVNNSSFIARIRRHLTAPQHEIKANRIKLLMLKEFYRCYENEMDPGKKIMLREYLDAYDNKNRLKVCYLILKYKMFKRGFFQSLMTFYQVLFFYDRIAEA
ncbi:MAG: glycosyltransferase family 2 protein [Mucilaginibacter sp.]|jgi:glycosyltransferase involved in cell wall biosynthesis